MKMLLMVYNQATDEEVMSGLGACCIENFTKWRKVLGKGQTSGPHLDSNIWPGANNVCMAVVGEEKVPAILGEIRNLRKTLGKEGVKAFVLPVEEIT